MIKFIISPGRSDYDTGKTGYQQRAPYPEWGHMQTKIDISKLCKGKAPVRKIIPLLVRAFMVFLQRYINFEIIHSKVNKLYVALNTKPRIFR